MYEQSNAVSKLISEIVIAREVDNYEAWLVEINDEMMRFSGFVSLDIIRPRDNNLLEYLILIRFDSEQTLSAWENSEVCKGLIAKSKALVQRNHTTKTPLNSKVWFNLSNQKKAPAFWKQVVLGVLAVYPLVIILNIILAPINNHLPNPIGILVTVIFISILLTYPVMPLLTRWLDRWLNK